MAHYAFLDENNIVTEVIAGREENEIVDGISDWEQHYGSLRNQICKRTSYNTHGNQHFGGGTPFRKNYAGIGYSYDEQRDAFIPPQRYPSWVLNEETCLWDAPIPQPPNTDTTYYFWNEEILNWEPVTFDGEEFSD